MSPVSNSLNNAINRILTSEDLSQARRRLFDGLPVPMRGVVRRALQREPLFEQQKSVISVVVPIYNVEEYLAECLRSIVNQSYSNLQIVLVDDGSTDGSLGIAKAFSRRDKRIVLVEQPNAGLGAARNTGMKHASGDYLVFADSDDVIPPNAYREMLRTLELSGSDFVVGAYFRMSETSEYLPPWLGELHEEERLGITSEEFTGGLANVFAWNKMFRMKFVDRIGLSFPEGVRYEDQYPLTRAYLLAEAFDVIPEVVYKWRIRFDGTSITQNKRSLDDVSDRVNVVKSVYEYLRENASQDFFDAWVAKVLGMDLMPYVSESLHADEEYRGQIQGLIHLLSDHLTPSIRAKIDVRTRVALYVLDQGSNNELGHVMLAHSEIGAHLPTVVDDDGTVRFSPTYPEEVRIKLPAHLLELGEEELRTDHGINRVSWNSGELSIEGWAFLRHIGLGVGDFPVARVYLRGSESGEELDLNVVRERQFVSRWYQSRWPDYDAAGFRASVNVDSLIPFAIEHGALEVRITVNQYGRTRDVAVSQVIRNGSAGSFESFVAATGTKIRLTLPRGEGLTVVAEPAAAVVSRIDIQSARVSVGYRVLDEGDNVDHAERQISLRPGKKRLSRRASLALDRGLFVPHELLPEGAQSRTDFLLARSRSGRLLWRGGRYAPQISSVRLDKGTLAVSGTGSPKVDFELGLESELHWIQAESVIWNGTEFTARIPLQIDEFEHMRTAPYGGYSVIARKGRKRARLRPARALHDVLPFDAGDSYFRMRLTRTASGGLWIDLSFPSTDEETGALGQARLQRWHRDADLEPIEESVFFQSYLGEQATDSALALHHELRRRFPKMKLYWGVVDRSVALPEGAIPVVRYTRDWYEKISRAEFLVNNIYFFSWFKKRPFQTYIQTWHGTPLKKIGRSYWEDRQRAPIWIERMDRQAASWDYLVSPNAFCTEKFAEEFRYSGTVIESGYPRNDVLAVGDPNVREHVRRRLAIPSNKKVILYAPTWRDNKSAQAWVAEFIQLLDLQSLARELGEEYIVLVRGHGHNARAGSTVGSSGRVVDVTYYPEINDLYAATDLVITDYSSVMFDFAVTGKPMLFFAPDLESYADGVRGFYLDYEDTVPGPVLSQQDEVAGVVRSLLESGWSPDRRYTSFVERFCGLEDGQASKRVVDAVWGLESPTAN